jgi:hypothetical protein
METHSDLDQLSDEITDRGGFVPVPPPAPAPVSVTASARKSKQSSFKPSPQKQSPVKRSVVDDSS